MRFALFVVGCALAQASVSPAAGPAGQVAASVITDGARIEAGAALRVGVRFEMQPGWHIYWSNPGDAGLATTVDLELPAGWAAGELQWPVPSRFEQPGGLVGYGYQGEVVLIREVVPPVGAPASVTVPVTASWLACEETCVLGDARLELALPAPGPAAAAGRELLDGWSARLPACDEPAPFDVSFRRDGVVGAVSTWLRWHRPADGVAWFPAADRTVRIEAERLASRGGLTRLDLSLRPTAGARLPDALRSVVVWTDPEGRRRGRCLPIQILGP